MFRITVYILSESSVLNALCSGLLVTKCLNFHFYHFLKEIRAIAIAVIVTSRRETVDFPPRMCFKVLSSKSYEIYRVSQPTYKRVAGRKSTRRAHVQLFIKLKVSFRKTQCRKSDIKRFTVTKWWSFKVIMWANIWAASPQHYLYY